MTQYEPEADSDVSDQDVEESMRESVGPVSRDRAERFYDRIRASITKYLSRTVLGDKSQTLLLLVPDVFMLLWRLVNDARVNAKNKMLLGSGLAYYIFPLDLMPEGLMGPAGFADDLVLGVYLINKLLSEVDSEVVREHWSGSEDVLLSMQRVLGAAENLIGSDTLNRLKKIAK
ncbi:MAG TPA: YkvA family protein [Thermoanaerobaculia bacterium]|jgi:uncharacterized membrane protein YkvA (DUF1232 family)